jgi:hypothetical protein
MVIGGRSSYLRVWLLVTSVSPLRAYLFKGGFAIFGKQRGGNSSSSSSSNTTAAPIGAGQPKEAARSSSSSSSGAVGQDFIVNLWMQDREKSPIWSLAQLEAYLDKHPEVVTPASPDASPEPAQPAGTHRHRRRHWRAALGKQQQSKTDDSETSTVTRAEAAAAAAGGAAAGRRRTFADAWADMRAASSLVLAAALPAMRAAAANASAPPGGAFEYFGLDFVLDDSLRPKLLEVNAVPSMARRRRTDCAGRKSVDECTLSAATLADLKGGSSGKSSGSSGSGRGSGKRSSLLDGFDEQKEAFVHDMLKILGLPVDAAAGGAKMSPAAALRAAAVALGGGGPRNATSGGSGETSEQAARRRRRLAAVPPELKALMCDGSSTSGGNSEPDASAFACVKCLLPSDLAALADVERELENLGRFEPAHDLILAHTLNRVASRRRDGGSSSSSSGSGSSADAAAGDGKDGQGEGGGGGDDAGQQQAATAAVAEAELQAAYRADDIGVWRRLRRAWQALTARRLPVRDLEVTQHFTTDSRLPPAAPLRLDRGDYLTSAWLRVRAEAEGEGGMVAAACGGGGGTGAGGRLGACMQARLKRLVTHCYL